MESLLKGKKFFTFEKGLACFTGILLIMLVVFSCNNIIAIKEGGSLIIALPGARAATASRFTIELTGTSGFTQSEPISGGTTVQFDDLAPDTYTINVKSMDDAGTLVFSGTETATVVAGETATVAVKLQNLLGSLTVDFSGTGTSSATEFEVELNIGDTPFTSKPVVGGTTAQFDDLDPDTYNISVKGKDDSGLVVLYGMSNATVEAGATASAKVNLGAVANDLNSLLEVIRNQSADGTIYVADGIEVGADLGVSYSANIIFQAGYENTTIKNNYGTLFQLFSSYEILVGGGDYTFTIDGTTAAGGKNTFSGMKISRINNATMGLVSNGIIQNYDTAISISGNSETQKSYFKLDGGLIKDNNVGIEVGANSVFTMTSGSIEGNTDKGVYVNGGTFNMMGGTIIGAGTSSGVYVESGTFTMSNNAVVDSSTSVYLAKDTFITISGKLNGAETVATITPNSYNPGDTIVKVADGVDLAAEVGKFKVTPKSDGTEWTIVVTETDAGQVGQLQQVQ